MTSDGKRITLRQKTAETLRTMPEKKLTGRELADKILAKYPDSIQEIRNNTVYDSYDEIAKYVAACIGTSMKHYRKLSPEIQRTKKRKVKFICITILKKLVTNLKQNMISKVIFQNSLLLAEVLQKKDF